MLLAALRRPSSSLPCFPSPALCRTSLDPNFVSPDRPLLACFWKSIALQYRQHAQSALLVRFYSSDGKRGDEASSDAEAVADSEAANESPACSEEAKPDVKVKGKKAKPQDEQSSTAKATLPGLWKRFLMKPKESKEPKEAKEVKETKETNTNEVQEVKEAKEIAEVKDVKENDAAVPAPAEEKRGGAIVPTFVRYEKVREVLVVPLTEKPAFPGLYRAPTITDPKLLDKILEDKAADKRFVGAFLLKDSSQLRTGVPTSWISDAESKDEDKLRGLTLYKQLYEYGTLCKVKNVTRMFNPPQVVLQGHVRLRLTGIVSEDPLVASVEWVKDKPFDAENDVLKATLLEAISTMQSLMMLSPFFREGISQFLQSGGSLYPPQVADCGIGLSTAEGATQQQGLEELDVLKRLNMALTLLKKDLDIYKLQMSIAKAIEEKVSGEQRKFFLMEQLKAIKKELGLEADDKTALSAKFRERVEQHKNGIPSHVLQVIEEELAKLQVLEASSSEFNVTRNYLDWLTSMPWGQYSEENFDVSRARKILDEDHYGLSDIKERIMEFIAVGKLRGTVQGKIICLSGPPGVGKTSIGKSIAKALNRKFFRFSVGGLSDVAEIKGHRRTYVGAMPGKMVQCLKSTGTANPLVLIDEIDKLGRGHAGDPASALLELLDPEQNANFLDHYLDVPIDLSKVLFVCTANVIETIPGPLLDRMEIIRLVGYISDEKMHIARDYLEPSARSGCGIKPEQATISEGALHVLIETYCREAGVRNLQKHIEKIYRKIALKLVSKDAEIQEKMKVVDVPTGSEENQKELIEDKEQNKESEKPTEEVEVRLESAECAEVVSEVILEEAESGNEVEIGNKDEAVILEQAEDKNSKEEIEVTEDAGEPKEQSLSEEHNNDRTTDGIIESAEQETLMEEQSKEETPVVIEKIVVDESNLSEYVGNAVFQSDRIYDQTPIGVVMGLAWTAMGGSTLYVETTLIEQSEGKGSLHLTGQLGDVMKESASIAHTVARAILRERDPENTFFKNTSLHLHVPAGATPKDGPSAGCTMITSLLSVAMNKPVKKDVAMTGEVTLTGRILPIGGVKEKTIAARRSAVKTLIFPKANKPDFDELLPHIKEGFDVKFVEHYMEIFRIAFGEEESSEASDKGAPVTTE